MARADKEIRGLWAEYARKRSEKLRNRLMEHYVPLVKQIAQRVHVKLPREVELDDLVSAGTFGLMYAIAAFDPRRKVKFETYCGSRIRGAILDELRSWDWVPRLVRVRSHKLSSATQQLQTELGREPSADELAARMKVSGKELRKVFRDGRLVRVLPLGRPATGEGEEEGHPGEVLEDPAATYRMRWLDRNDVKRLIATEMSRAEQLILVLYYYEEMTMKEIGLTLDLSESRVSQMHSSILARLRARLSGKLVGPQSAVA